MFSQLVESDPHKGELKRKGFFFLATMAAYALILMATGMVGVYAYEAHIDDQNLELVALVPPNTEEPQPREVQRRPRDSTPASPSNTGSPRNMGGPTQTAPSNTSPDPTKIAGAAQASTNQPPPENIGGGNRTFPFSTGSYNPNGNDTDSAAATGNRGGKLIDEEPPPVKKQETPAKTIQNIGVANSRAISLPEPVYPQLARVAGIEGIVTVEILIDETGRVMSARATSGNPLLRPEAERAAARARFTPTTLSNQPVKAKGIITFNFVLRR